MKKEKCTMEMYKFYSGRTITLAEIKFVILDTAYDGIDGDMFLLTANSQNDSVFGETNNYTESVLKDVTEEWLSGLPSQLKEVIKPRAIDLVTLDGKKDYGVLEAMAAPLTTAEFRKYAGVIPNCDKAYWLSTGYSTPKHYGSTFVRRMDSDGDTGQSNCSDSCGVRLALVVSSSVLHDKEKWTISTEDELVDYVIQLAQDGNDYKFYEVEFGDMDENGFCQWGTYSMAIKAEHEPTYEEVEKFLSNDMAALGWKHVMDVREISREEVEFFFDTTNEATWPILK
jgi:hypothetical protein